MTWQTQEEVDTVVRNGITQKLTDLIRSYGGSPNVAKEILRGLAAARWMDMDCRVFEDQIAERHRALGAE